MARAIIIIPPIPMDIVMMIAETGNHVGNEPWPSLEWASWVFDRASFVLIGSLVIGVAATVAIVWMGIIKEHHWDLAREDAANSIAALSLQGDQLKKDTAEANARAAEANQKAEQERLERIRLEAIVAPRSLTLGQQQSMASALSGFSGQRVSVITYSLDAEGAGLAYQIMAVLTAADIIPVNDLASQMPFGGFSIGVHVTGGNVALVNTLRMTLTGIGNLFVAPPDQSSAGLGGPSVSTDKPGEAKPIAATILVAAKPVMIIAR